MATSKRSDSVARQLRAACDAGAVGGLDDGELLARFEGGTREAADAAFSALVERHGPMVLRVCRAGLRDSHDAEDAFQATFLVLARRAGSLTVVDSLGPWLHGVACRVSAGARTSERRRLGKIRLAAEVAAARPGPEPRDDLGPALHEEIDRLPARFRAAVVLCHLEGLTHEQAAARLACPVGTVRSRLARGRDRLRRALARRGLAPTSAHEAPGPLAIPPALALAATRGARLASDASPTGLLSRWLIPSTQGVSAMLAAHPIRLLTLATLLAGTLALGLKAGTGQGPATKPPAADSPVAEPRPIPPDEARLAALAAMQKRLQDEARLAAMETRLRDLERKLAAIEGDGPGKVPAAVAPRVLRKVRPQFDDVLISRVFVKPDQVLKKGDPLVEIRSALLGQAKNDCRTKFVQWDHDHKYLAAREPLARDGRITPSVWVDTQTDEKKSRLDYLASREKLAIYGLADEEIDKLLETLRDDTKADEIRPAAARDLTTMTITAPVDGRVAEVGAEIGNFYGTRDLLVGIEVEKP